MPASKKGRNLRKPSCARYTNEKRWILNKEKKIKKQEKIEMKAKLKREKLKEKINARHIIKKPDVEPENETV